MTSRHEARSARKAGGDGLRGYCTKGHGWKRTMSGVHELKLLERRGFAALTLAWNARKGSRACQHRDGVGGGEAHQGEGPLHLCRF